MDMNIRVDNTNLAEVTRTNSKTEMKGNVTVAAQETEVQQMEKDTGKVTSVQQTVVEAPRRTKESQIEKIQQDAENAESQRIKQQMEIVSNTMSEKDCQEMDGDGFSVNGTEVETIVTEMDKIKAELAKAGVDISIFGDDLSKEQLEAMAGSAGLANQLESAISQAGLPPTEENISDCQETLKQAADLTDCREETIKYMLKQELPPTVENLYKAQHSTGSASAGSKGAGFVMDDSLKAQVEQIITRAGLPVNEDTLGVSQWMLEEQIPLTEENLRYAFDLKNLKLPPEPEQLVGAMMEAVAEGKRPMDAIVLEGYSKIDRANQAAQTISQATDADVLSIVRKGLPFTIENLAAEQNAAGRQGNQTPSQSQAAPLYHEEDMEFLTAKRKLEETRLIMTAQANYALLKQGIAIETKPLEELVDQLKSLEESYYKNLLSQSGVEGAAEHAAVFAETMGKAGELAEVPAYLLGSIRTGTDNINTMHETGISQKAELERAGEAYEALRTAPRADMGDSIRKAFQNVDDILRDLQLEETEPNRRAVRILAYNQMEINPESIASIKGADQKVQNMFQNLTPSVVMEMIREGVNPLELSVEQLNSKAQEIKGRMEDAGEEKFSKYLWKLEQNHEINPQERDSYIGIYRLLSQIDKTDGAVIGALVHQGAELSMKNLLSAVRTNRNSGINVSVDDKFGGVDAVSSQELSISQQIEAAYQTDCAKEAFAMVTPEGLQQAMGNGAAGGSGNQAGMPDGAGKAFGEMTPEELLWQMKQAPEDAQSEEAYYREQLQEFAGAKEAEAQVIQLLNGYDMPVTAYNIMAANQMINNRNGLFKSLFDHKNLEREIDFEEVKEGILEDFAEAVKTPEEMAEAQKKLAEVAENVMKTMIESEPVGSADLRGMRIVKQQIELGTRMAKEENYAIPVLVADELTNVQLKIVRGKEEKGRVDIMFESPALGKVAASFQVQPEAVKGYVISDSPQTIAELKEHEDELREQVSPDAEDAWNMDMICSDNLDLSRISFGEKEAEQPGQTEESRKIQTKTLYGVARAFLEEVKQAGQNMQKAEEV